MFGPFRSLRDRGLQFKISILMLLLCVGSMGSVFIPYFRGQETLKHDIEQNFLDLSNAIQVSVDQMTAVEEPVPGQDALQSYAATLKKQKGISEVTILSAEDDGVIASTNPKLLSNPPKIRLPKEKLVINATFGEDPHNPKDAGDKGIFRDLLVPIRVGGDTLGIIHVRMQFDDMTDAIRKNLYLRTVSTLLIFGLGLLLAVGLSTRYVRPLEDLAKAADKVSAGDLSPELPVRSGDEVGRVTKSFNEMVARLRKNRELEEKVREAQYLSHLGRLSSGVAHEIRNPLNFIGLAIDHLDALTVGKSSESEAEKAQILGRIREEIARLNELVTNFIMYGKPKTPTLTRVLPTEIVESVLRMASDRMTAQKVECRCDFRDGDDILLDPDMIRRAVLNVVANALDAMPSGGGLAVASGPVDGGWEVAVADDGVGIPEELKEKIFEPYFTTKSSGLGLGLILTKKIIEAHGGTIGVASEPGKGTRISIFLPTRSDSSADVPVVG